MSGDGVSSPDVPAGEARKVVSVLFCDLVGYTSRGEGLDPEALRRLQQGYFDAARATLERHGGTVEKFIGDAVMAVFGLPLVHEDDALRAVRAAAELLQAVHGLGLDARIGVDTGEVVAGLSDALVTGDAVNVAARLQQAAAPGEILLGERTFRLCPDAVRVEPAGPLRLRGKAEPVTAFRLSEVLENAPAFARRLDTPLVGRGRELERLRACLERAVSERRCWALTVVGSPGVGKTRLAREFAASSSRAEVLAGGCLPYGESITYAPVLQVARTADGGEELAAALSGGTPEDVSWSVRKWLERRARDHPVVLLLDDVHWAEPPLLDLVEHLVDWTRDAQLLVVCLARPAFLERRPGWTGDRSNAEALTLPALDDREARTLADALLAGIDVGEHDRVRVRQLAGGNPLFVEQLVAALAAGGDLDAVPSTIQALLGARLDALPPDQRELLERASVIGMEFAWEALADLSPERRRPSGALLSSLVRQELIRPHGALEDVFEFRHVLVRDAAHERIPKARRAELHVRVADHLERRPETRRDELVGYHLEQAHRYRSELTALDEASELAARAGGLLGRAGLRALARSDVQAAADLLGRACALLPDRAPERLRFLPELGGALAEAGRLEQAQSVLEEAVEQARAAGDRAAEGRALIERQFLRLITESAEWTDEAEAVVDDLLPFFERLGDHLVLARLWRLKGTVALMRSRYGEQLAAMEQALRHARSAGDEREQGHALFWIPDAVAWGPTPAEAGVRRCEALLREELGPSSEAGVRHALGFLYAAAGRRDDARAELCASRALYRELGLEVLWGATAIGHALAELCLGDAAAAERLLVEATTGLERLGERAYRSTAAAVLAEALNDQGRHAEAEAATRLSEELASVDDTPSQISWRSQRARALSHRGELEEAERLAREALALAGPTDSPHAKAEAAAALAEVLARGGRTREAAEAASASLREWERKGVLGRVEAVRAVLARLGSAP